MTQAKQHIHFHLGVQGVCEGDLMPFLGTARLSPKAQPIGLVPDDLFHEMFRAPIADGDAETLSATMKSCRQIAQAWVFSRPRFLYAGEPLNLVETAQLQPYKVRTVARAFRNDRLTFHLFVTDHVTYLGHHCLKSDLVKSEGQRPSWIPLVTAIKEAIGTAGELVVWNGEDPIALLQDFGRTVSAGLQGQPPKAEPKPTHSTLEDAVARAGWSASELDSYYDDDLDYLAKSGLLGPHPSLVTQT